MQPLDNDMDNLMRKAATDYPVKPQGADWQKLAQQLDASEPAVKNNGHGVLKKLLFFSPFILAGFVCDRFFIQGHGLLKKREWTENIKSNQDKANVSTVRNRSKTAGIIYINKKKTDPVNVLLQTKITGNTIVENNEFSTLDFPRVDIGISKSYVFPATYNSELTFGAEPKNFVPSGIAKKMQRINFAARDLIGKNSKTTKDNTIEKVYISFVGGPDFSRVKAQKMERAGYSIGILAGYNFTKKWTVESGLLWDRKAYFSKGKYFKTDKIYLPQHSEILQVTGYCAMFEIPVNLRYNLLRKNSKVLFASAGVSSYLMQKEDYNYVYRRYNVDYAGTKVYKRESKDWLSVANVSFGYEQRMGNKTKIRIEPYLKIPLKGVGIGSLPLQSTGILVGITHPIH